MLTDIKSRYGVVWALLETGIKPLLDPQKKWREDDPEIAEFRDRCKRSPKIQTMLGMNVGSSSPMHWWHRVLKRLGLSLAHKQLRDSEEKETRYRLYWIDGKSWNDSYRQAILSTFDERWEQYLSDEYEQPEFETSTVEPEQDSAVTSTPVEILNLAPPVTDGEEEALRQKAEAEVQEIADWIVQAVNNGGEALRELITTANEAIEGIYGVTMERVWKAMPFFTRVELVGLNLKSAFVAD